MKASHLLLWKPQTKIQSVLNCASQISTFMMARTKKMGRMRYNPCIAKAAIARSSSTLRLDHQRKGKAMHKLER